MTTIKNALTSRKIRNKGHTPIRYQLPDAGGFVHGYVESRGRKWLHLQLVGIGHKRVPISEERYIKELTR